MPHHTEIDTTLQNPYFYRDSYRFMLKVALIEGAVILFLCLAIWGTLVNYTPHEEYFASMTNGRLVPISSLDQAGMSDNEIANWVWGVMQQGFTLTPNDYEAQLAKASQGFTPSGYAAFRESLGGILANVQNNNASVKVQFAGYEIISQGTEDGIYEWFLEMQLQIILEAGADAQVFPAEASMQIIRVPNLEKPLGIGINGWELRT